MEYPYLANDESETLKRKLTVFVLEEFIGKRVKEELKITWCMSQNKNKDQMPWEFRGRNTIQHEL